MKSLKFSAAILSLLIFAASNGGAAPVESALSPSNIGIPVQFAYGTAADLPQNKPSAMSSPAYGFHLGTNTDLYAIGPTSGSPSEFWVRYTLDSSSYLHRHWQDMGSTYDVTTPLSGDFWLSFNLTTQKFNAYSDNLNLPNLYTDVGAGRGAAFVPETGLSAINILFQGHGEQFPNYSQEGTNADLSQVAQACVECSFATTINLPFLELRWSGNGYDLYTSSKGFSQVITNTVTDPTNFGTYNYALNIAPVPLPGTAVLFSSSLIGLFKIMRRRRHTKYILFKK